MFRDSESEIGWEQDSLFPSVLQEMNDIKIYEVSETYVDYLAPYSPHLFRNRTQGQKNSRKYIGVVLRIEEMEYFAPLSSFKDKHRKMSETLDFIKIKNYSVINLNNMFPVPDGCYSYVDISKEQNQKYKSLLLAEYRYIKSIRNKILKNARIDEADFSCGKIAISRQV